MIETVAVLAERGIRGKRLGERIDTTTGGGKLVFHVTGALADFERDLIRERTQAGLAAARARGRRRWPKALADATKLALARALDDGGRIDIATVRTTLGVSGSHLHRYVRPLSRVPPTGA